MSEQSKSIQRTKKDTPIIEGMENDMVKAIVESIAPNIGNFLDMFIKQLSEYIKDEKTIIIRKQKDKPVLALVFDNNKEFKVTGKEVVGDEDALLHIFTEDNLKDLASVIPNIF